MQTKVVEYQQGQTTLEGYLAYAGKPGEKRPGVLVCHEWMGLGDYERSRAEQLATAGYSALAVDIFGKGVRPKNQEEAAAQATKYRTDRPLLRQRLIAALETIRRQESVDPSRIAVIGYCFGGCAALELARAGADVKAVVTFHASLNSPLPATPGNFHAKVLVFNGAEDPLVPTEMIAEFQQEMKTIKADYTLTHFGGVYHSFSNPRAGADASTGFKYDKVADTRSWNGMMAFFREEL
jgi:dienelactone hydrolase